MNTTHDDAQTWRDLTDQLTADQLTHLGTSSVMRAASPPKLPTAS
jgi:hypothetical protein